MAGYRNALGVELALSGARANTIFGTAGRDTLTGTTGNDAIRGYGGGDTYVGGKGDDTYYVNDTADKVVELAGEGIDTVRASGKYVLSANIENLYLDGAAAIYGEGNALDNIIVGTADNQTLNGGAGNDVLVVGGKGTILVVAKGNGSDAIVGFNGDDQIRLDGYGLTTFAQVKSIAKQVGADTELAFANGEKLVLRDTQAAGLQANQFMLSLDSSKLKLTFADEFDSLSLYSQGGTWRTEYGTGGPGTNASRRLNNEAEIYMDAAYKGTGDKALGINPFSIDKGVLTITATPTPEAAKQYLDNQAYTSGLLTSKFTFAQEYGYFEIRAKLPSGQGLWPAFWLLPTSGGWPPELDVFEQLGKDPSTIYMSTIGSDNGKNAVTTNVVNVDTTQFHTYGVDWGPDVVTFYIDGNAVGTQQTPDAMKDKEMYLLTNLAVGGGGWAGSWDSTTGTAQMQIDYIRAYSTSSTVSTTVNGVHTVLSTADKTAPATDAAVAASSATTAPPPTAAAAPAVVSAAVTAPVTAARTTVATTAATPVPATPLQTYGTVGADKLAGTSAETELWGYGGNDEMRGGSGKTILHGGTGDDVYYVTSTLHVVQENADEGTDTVRSTIGYTLGANVETLVLEGAANIDGTGNALDNRIIGNTGNNILSGGDGNDMLDGGTAGTDTLIGGLGNDVYYVNHAGTTIVELANGGIDSVQAAITYTLTDNVETLVLTGAGNINGTGNALDNRIVGNAGNNVLTGGAGNDQLSGGGGADIFAFTPGSGKDLILDFKGDDALSFKGYDKAKLHIVQVGANTVIDFGGADTITLAGVSAKDPSLLSHIFF